MSGSLSHVLEENLFKEYGPLGELVLEQQKLIQEQGERIRTLELAIQKMAEQMEKLAAKNKASKACSAKSLSRLITCY